MRTRIVAALIVATFAQAPACERQELLPAKRRVGVDEAESERQRLILLEQVMMAGGNDWYSAYRALVTVGPPGWKIICDHELDIRKETDHLRLPIDLGGLTHADGFAEYCGRRLHERMEDEAWARAYAGSAVRVYSRSMLSIPDHMETLRKHFDDPSGARWAIAFLTSLTGRDFGFPWHGPKERQQEAIRRWLAFWDEHQNDEEFEFGH